MPLMANFASPEYCHTLLQGDSIYPLDPKAEVFVSGLIAAEKAELYLPEEWYDDQDQPIIAGIASGGYPVKTGEDLIYPRSFVKIVEDCLELEAANRPTMQEVTDNLATVLNDLGDVLDHVMHWLPTAIHAS